MHQLCRNCNAKVMATGGRGLRSTLSPAATKNLIRSGSKRAEALEKLTGEVAELQNTLQVRKLHPAYVLVTRVNCPASCRNYYLLHFLTSPHAKSAC